LDAALSGARRIHRQKFSAANALVTESYTSYFLLISRISGAPRRLGSRRASRAAPNFRLHVRERDDLFDFEEAAAFAPHLVLDMERGPAHGALDVNRFAIARVGVADDGDVHRPRKCPDVLDHLSHREQAEIGKATRGRGPEAGHIDRFKSVALGEACLEAVVDERCDHISGPFSSFCKRDRGSGIRPVSLDSRASPSAETIPEPRPILSA
jgi:hypothetical protein